MRVVCSWCGAEKLPTGVWMDLAPVEPDDMGISHGICPACTERMEDELVALEGELDTHG